METSDQEYPPLRFGLKRLYYQFSVFIPQMHILLISILQGAVVSRLLTESIPLLVNPSDVRDPQSIFIFFQHQFFYMPYIISSLVILIGLLDFVYTSLIFTWPLTAFQYSLVFLLTLAEVAMINTVKNFPIWWCAVGWVSITGGILHRNNYRIFIGKIEAMFDPEYANFGKEILEKGRSWGRIYLVSGCQGVICGVFDLFGLTWASGIVPLLKVPDLVRWISYILILIYISYLLYQSGKEYRRWLLVELTGAKGTTEVMKTFDVDKSSEVITLHKEDSSMSKNHHAPSSQPPAQELKASPLAPLTSNPGPNSATPPIKRPNGLGGILLALLVLVILILRRIGKHRKELDQ